MKYQKVTMENQWEYLTFKVGRTELAPSKHKHLRIKWPNGKTFKVKLWWRERTESYDDMGHTYYSTSYVPYFKFPVHGATLELRLDTIKYASLEKNGKAG